MLADLPKAMCLITARDMLFVVEHYCSDNFLIHLAVTCVNINQYYMEVETLHWVLLEMIIYKFLSWGGGVGQPSARPRTVGTHSQVAVTGFTQQLCFRETPQFPATSVGLRIPQGHGAARSRTCHTDSWQRRGPSQCTCIGISPCPGPRPGCYVLSLWNLEGGAGRFSPSFAGGAGGANREPEEEEEEALRVPGRGRGTPFLPHHAGAPGCGAQGGPPLTPSPL